MKEYTFIIDAQLTAIREGDFTPHKKETIIANIKDILLHDLDIFDDVLLTVKIFENDVSNEVGVE